MKNVLFSLTALFTAGTTHAEQNYQYLCHSYYENGSDGEHITLKLDLNSNRATGETEEMFDITIGGDIKPNYRSRGAVKYVKFGYNLIVEEVMLTGGKQLRDGSNGGFARLEGQAEGGFYQYKFVCKIQE